MKFYTKNIHIFTIDFRKNYYLCIKKSKENNIENMEKNNAITP